MRDRYLAAMGIDVWKLRAPVTAPGHEADSSDMPRSAAAPEARAEIAGQAGAEATAGADGRGHPGALPEPGPSAARAAAAGATPAPAPDWEQLAAAVSACTLCSLHRTRTQTVFGVGRRDADLLVIGEAPGADEDREGEPFVGRAGRLLNAMLRAIGFAREDVYIANILKCRPPSNRDPKPDEAASCSPYLERQIALIRPRAVLGVGRIAAQHLLQSDQPIGRLRGRVLSFGAEQTPIVVTYHPAYLLRSPAAKAKAWQDLCAVRRLIRA
jgi:uracil-DNA glycosylase